jgi:hypothetical protein
MFSTAWQIFKLWIFPRMSMTHKCPQTVGNKNEKHAEQHNETGNEADKETDRQKG